MSTIKINIQQKKNSNRQISNRDKSAEKECDESKKKQVFKADRTKSLLENVYSKIDILDIENFDILFPELISSMKEAALLRDELIQEIGSEELMKTRPELFSTAKQIEKKYDNIVEKYSREEKRLEKELSGVISKKKITNYLRY